ncbi:MAG: hypothetical protein RR551_00040 [Mucinivorans sp.]
MKGQGVIYGWWLGLVVGGWWLGVGGWGWWLGLVAGSVFGVID